MMDWETWFWMYLVRPMLEGVRVDLLGRWKRVWVGGNEVFQKALIVDDCIADILKRFGSPLTVGQAIDACLSGKTVRMTRRYLDGLVWWDVTWTDNGGGWWVCVRERSGYKSESKEFPCDLGAASLNITTFELVD